MNRSRPRLHRGNHPTFPASWLAKSRSAILSRPKCHETFMREAIKLAEDGMAAGQGGPFGCVIVRAGQVVGRGNNRVTSTNDPTAHAEVTAIRDACKNLRAFQLTDCELYTSCEPCPM